MSILDEFRFPTRWYTKISMAVLALLFFGVVATSAIAGFLVYRIVKPQRSSSEINNGTAFPGGPMRKVFRSGLRASAKDGFIRG